MTDRTVRVFLDAVTQAYESKMAKAGVTTRSVTGSMEQLGQRGSQSLNQLSGGLVDVTGRTAALAGGAALAGAAVVKWAQASADAYVNLADKIDTVADVTGASTEQASELVAIADGLGVSVDSVASGLFKMSRATSENEDTLRGFGVQIERNRDGSVDLVETLLNVGDAYRRLSPERGNELLVAAFGRGGDKMIDILERSRGEMEALVDAAREHGRIWDDPAMVERAQEYERATRKLDDALQEFLITGGEDVVPLLTDITEGLTRLVEVANDLPGPGVFDFLEAGLKNAPGVGPIVRGLDFLGGGEQKTQSWTTGMGNLVEQIVGDLSDLDTEAASIEEYAKALEALAAAAFDVQAASDDVAGGVGDLAAQVREGIKAGDGFAASLDGASEAGLANRAAVRDLAVGVLDLATKLRQQGSSESEVASVTALYRAQLIDTLTQLGFNRSEVERYLGVLGLIPSHVDTEITLDDTQAMETIARVRAAVLDLFAAIRGLFGGGGENGDAARSEADALAGLAGVSGAADADARRPSSSSAPKGPSAEDLRRDEDDRWRRMWEFGGVTNAEYEAYLSRRLAATADFTAEDERLRQQYDQMQARIGEGMRDAAEYMQGLEEAGWEVLRRQHEMGEISTQEFLAALERRLAGLEKYSAEYMDTWREINQLRDDISADELAIIAAVDKQRRYDEAFADAAYQRALSDLRMTAVPQAPVVVHAGATKSWSPTITMVTPDPARSGESVLQRSRDDAYLRDL